MSRRKVLVVSLGGTITMTRGAEGGLAPTLTATDLIGAVPELERVAEIETLSPASVPSASLSIDTLLQVATLIDGRLMNDVDGVVVVQGTDTIEESAFLFDLLVESDRPVVVTGAMRGPGTPGADGPANLLAAVTVASARDAIGRGTMVVLNDEIHAARFVQKSHTALPSAFASPSAGPIGLITENKPRFYFGRGNRPAHSFNLSSAEPAPVALIKMCLGDDGRLLGLLQHAGYRGLVLEGMGVGHVPANVAPLISEILTAMPVILSTRVQAGPSFTSSYAFPGSEMDLVKRGVIASGYLSSLKARLLLSILLRSGTDRHNIMEMFRQFI